MKDEDALIKISEYNTVFNDILGLDIPNKMICYSKEGLPAHLKNSGHSDCLQYIPQLHEMTLTPDYIGVNPREAGKSIELVKVVDGNVLIGIKYDQAKEYLYVASIYKIPQSKLERRLYSGRLKKYANAIDNM